MRARLPPSSATMVDRGFSAPTCHIGKKLDVQHFRGFVIAFNGRFLGRVVFDSREDAKGAAIGQSGSTWDELLAEGWDILPVRSEVTLVNA